jgi:transcriptional regulator with XRE-family HTH domain
MNISERVDLLFKTILDEDGNEYSYRQVEKMGGGEISFAAIWKLRVGRTKNPTRKMLRVLSKAFGVPIAYFFDEDVSLDSLPQYQETYRERQDEILDKIALRAGDLDANGRKAILDLIEYIQRTKPE